jgi:hypothetical protein
VYWGKEGVLNGQLLGMVGVEDMRTSFTTTIMPTCGGAGDGVYF